MFPNKYLPNNGTFVYEQVKALSKLIKGRITVIAPVPWSPRILWFNSKWRQYGEIEKETVMDGIRVYYRRYIVIPGLIFSHLNGLFLYLSVKRLVRRLLRNNERITVLHSHSILPAGLSGVLLAKKYGFPHICTIHGSDINIYPFWTKLYFLLTKYTLKRCLHLVFVSEKLKQKAQSIVKGLNNNISIVNNGADNEKFKPIPMEIAKKELGINETHKIILFVGDLISIKGINYLIEALGLLLKDYEKKDVMLYLIGNGSERDKLISLTRSLSVEEKVFFLGSKPHNEIPLWLNIADIFVLPSISEGFPTVLVEAMMCGLPVIASNVGGISEIVVHNKTGFIVEPKNSQQIKEYMKLLLEDKIIRKKFSDEALYSSIKFTWNNNAIKHIKIYNSVLEKADGR